MQFPKKLNKWRGYGRIIGLTLGLLLAAGCHRANVEPQTEAPEDAPQVLPAKPKAQKKVEQAQTRPVESSSPVAAPATAQPQFTQPQPAPKAGHGKKAEADALFSKPTVLEIELFLSPVGMDLLRRANWGNGTRPIARATVREGGVIYTNVALHLKGSAGSFRSLDDKPAMTLNFDKFVPGQSFHGLHKISLNNSVQDPSYLCEQISRELFIAAGVPAPRASHALVTLNGRDLGFYVLLEGANRQFLKRYFDNPNGNLYDGGFCRDLSTSLHVGCGENPKDHSGLRALIAAARERPPDFEHLEQVLDMDRFLSMVCLEMMLCHWDGYTLNRNNWRIFNDLETRKMVFIPHGLDQMFGIGGRFQGRGNILPNNISGSVSAAVLGTPEGKQRYLERFEQIYTNVFKVDDIVRRVDELTVGIMPILEESHPALASEFQKHATSLRRRIIRRDQVLRGQIDDLGPPPSPIEFGQNGVIQLTDWKASPVRSGDPTLAESKSPEGLALLTINAGATTSSSSWRTRVVLGAGQYRFEGRVRLEDVVVDEGDARGGAGLRISKGTMPHKWSGTSDWKEFSYPFVVQKSGAEVELICELRASKGVAWFDRGSLRLVRR